MYYIHSYLLLISASLNNGSPTRINRPFLNHMIVDVSFVSSNLFWSSDWTALDESYGSDHILIKISLPLSKSALYNNVIENNKVNY